VNEVSDDDDKKTEKEAVTEIKKLDSGVRDFLAVDH